MQKFTNGARATLASTINGTDTALTIESGGSLFPVANTDTNSISSAYDWFKVVLQDLTGIEIVYVRTHTSGSTSFSNILRGQEGTTAREFLAGAVVALRQTAADAETVSNHVLESDPHTQYVLESTIGTAVQAWGAKLDGIKDLANPGSTGFLKLSNAGAWSVDTATYLTENQSITVSGDASGSGTTAITLTLATVPATKGGTGQTSYAVGDLLYASTTTALSKLAGVATGNALISGGVSTAPSWGKIGLTTHISGTLAVGNGGTGATTLTGLIKGNGTSAFTAAVAGTDYLAPAAIGSTVQGYDANTAKLNAAQTWTATQTFDSVVLNKDIKEKVFTITDGASVDINPANGTIQVWTLGANRTPTATSFAAGQSVTLMVADGTSTYTVDWATNMAVVWVGASAPALPTSGYAVITLWKVGTTIYGVDGGDVA